MSTTKPKSKPKPNPVSAANFDFDALLDGTGIPPGYTYRQLPAVSRDRALHGRMNGGIKELAGVTLPRSAKKRANSPRTAFTGLIS